MSGIDFYYMPESPPCRTVMMVAELVGVEMNKKYLNLGQKEHLKEDFIKLNPLHKVPFIVDRDLKINESRAIATYLIDRYANDDALYPKDSVRRAEVDELLYFDATQLYASLSKLFSPRFFLGIKELDQANEKSMLDVLDYLNKRLRDNGGKKFMLSDRLTVADLSMAATFTMLEANDYDITSYEHLGLYLKSLKNSIPGYEKINKEPVENMRNFIKMRCSGQPKLE